MSYRVVKIKFEKNIDTIGPSDLSTVTRKVLDGKGGGKIFRKENIYVTI